MHKQFLGNVITAKTLLFLLSVYTPLHGMDSNSDNVCKEIVIANMHPNMHRTLARLNSTYNNIVEKNHRPDKKRIEQLMWRGCTLIIPKQISWNKDFNTCAWVAAEQNPFIHAKKLELTLVRLDDDSKDIIVQTGLCHGYKYPAMDGQDRPFFDKEGGIFYYGIGDKMGGSGNPTCLVEYSLTFDSTIRIKRCVIGVSDSKIFYPHALTNYPVLLKAILQSTQVHDEFGVCEGIEKVYHINGVIIPENHMFFKKHHAFEQRPWVDDNLSDELRKMIEKSYAKQQREKNSQISQKK
jgi:hypothetical protein